MGDDEYLNIKLTNNKTQNIKDETLLKQIGNKESINRRFVNYKTTVTLLTNLSPEFVNLTELKELYTIRW